MKILYYSSPSFADCDFPLIKKYQEKGFDVTYLIDLSPSSCKRTLFNIERCLPVNDIIPATSYKELDIYKEYMDMTKVYIINKGNVGKKNYLRSLRLTLKIARFINEGHFDVLHTDILFVSLQPLLYLLCKPWVITKHDPFPHSEEVSRISDLYRKISFHLCKNFVVLNTNQLDRFCETYNINKSNVLVNRLGVYDNIKVFVKKEWKKREKNVLFFGRITPYKGLEYLCEAMKAVHNELPEATLTIAGGGQLYFDFEPYMSDSFIELKNRFINLDELARMLYEASVVVCPYKEATQSGVVMTAFSLCKPVIVTNVGGLAEMVDEGKSGIVVEPCDADSLSKAILTILKDSAVLNNYQQYIRENYLSGEKSWDSIAEKYVDFYKKVIKGG